MHPSVSAILVSLEIIAPTALVDTGVHHARNVSQIVERHLAEVSVDQGYMEMEHALARNNTILQTGASLVQKATHLLKRPNPARRRFPLLNQFLPIALLAYWASYL